jgi:colanic acid biosynthesis glycosyl transferase WcaI
MKNILVWSPNYAPDLTGIPPLVTDSAEWLSARGHNVRVVTTVPHYPQRRIDPTYRGRLWWSETRNGVPVARSWLHVRQRESFVDKALYELTVSGMSLPRVAASCRDADVLVCVVPTLAAAAAAGLLRRIHPRTRLVLWVQDLVVLAASSVPDLPPGAERLLRAARAVERFAIRSADATIVCSPGFRDYYRSIGVDVGRVITLLNWTRIDRSQDAPRPVSAQTRFLYAGNLGYTQGFETLVEAAARAGDEVMVEIVGDGNAAQTVKDLSRARHNVVLRDPVPEDDLPDLLARAHVHVVIQRRVAAGANLPSKIATYMASGRAVVAAIDPSTAAADLLRRSGGAVLVEPESPAELAAAMLHLARNPAARDDLGRRARTFALRMFSREHALRRLEAAVAG